MLLKNRPVDDFSSDQVRSDLMKFNEPATNAMTGMADACYISTRHTPTPVDKNICNGKSGCISTASNTAG